MVKILIIGLGGFIGAIMRYGLSGLAHRLTNGSFPVGTLVVNVLGCLVIGALMTLVIERSMLSQHARSFLLIGLLGSFTTFSTFGYETWALVADGELRWALWNVAGNLVLGLLAVWLGGVVVKVAGV